MKEDPDPPSHPEPEPDAGVIQVSKILKMCDSDLNNLGYTEGCQRCPSGQRGQTLVARSTRHSGECRKRLGDAMRKARTEKKKKKKKKKTKKK